MYPVQIWFLETPAYPHIVSIMDLAGIRTDYHQGRLRREDLKPDAIEQFNLWLADAINAKLIEPNAMSLATAGKDGRPLLRTVLLKGVDAHGFQFFTNLESRKARQIEENAAVSLLFPWLALERQVIVTGTAQRVSTAEAANYFQTRPRDSQLAAWASRQSTVISSRDVLETEWEKFKEKFGAGEVPMPPFWGGYCIKPATIEFWYGGPSRLHDRFEYQRQADDSWKIERLSP
jgi:pyridoxamine 5'-phosphate oxidase